MELVTEYRATASHPILPLDAAYPTLGQAAKA